MHSIGTLTKQVAGGLRNLNIDVLNSKLASLESSRSAQFRRRIVVDVARGIPQWEETHRQNSQERSLASIL
jgi:hypothetical protein